MMAPSSEYQYSAVMLQT